MRHTLTGRHARTVTKLVVEQSSQKIVGAHMLGNDAPEMMQGIAVKITAGATKADFDQTVGNSSHRGGGVGRDADQDRVAGVEAKAAE
jgi:glutathione reductase (NADPH)